MLATLFRSAALGLLLFSYAKANYYIDDSNSTISYLPVESWRKYIFSTAADASPYDITKIYNKTGHFAGRGSTAEIPFTGSGITLYIFCDGGGVCGFNASIDGGAPTPHWRPTPSNVNLYNLSMYDVQGLYSDRAHNLYIEPWDNTADFDYALVNDTVFLPSPTTTSQTTPTPTHSTLGSSKKVNVVGPAVGGAVGGIVVIAGVAFLILSLRRKKVARDAAEIDPGPKSATYDDIPPMPITTVPTLSHSVVPHEEARHSMEPKSSMRSSQQLPLDTTVQTMAVPTERHTTPPTNTSPRIPQPSAASNELSDEQVGFVHDLYDLNVPAPAIARVINEMVRRREGSGGGSGAGVAPGTTWSRHEEPPNYNV